MLMSESNLEAKVVTDVLATAQWRSARQHTVEIKDIIKCSNDSDRPVAFEREVSPVIWTPQRASQ